MLPAILGGIRHAVSYGVTQNTGKEKGTELIGFNGLIVRCIAYLCALLVGIALAVNPMAIWEIGHVEVAIAHIHEVLTRIWVMKGGPYVMLVASGLLMVCVVFCHSN